MTVYLTYDREAGFIIEQEETSGSQKIELPTEEVARIERHYREEREIQRLLRGLWDEEEEEREIQRLLRDR
jgi:hypothetical protein